MFLLRTLCIVFTLIGGALAQEPERSFRAGAAAVEITPEKWPVLVNAMFTERTADKVTDPLFAKALVLDDGVSRVALCVVDTCMLPRDLIDRAKELATAASGIPVEKMLVSATHTHSAPSAMGCLGSRVDPEYAAALPPKIAAAIIKAAGKLAPARVGWAGVDDWEHTFNRRWIRRPDKMLSDPFGVKNVRANMHPGYKSPDAVGPSGPVDPELSVLAVETPDGKPMAVLANYSQHYYGSPLVSSDYYGRFARHLAKALGADDTFVGIMSQGTSGDQMWMDYGAPAREIGYDLYAQQVAERAVEAYRNIAWKTAVPLRMAERKLTLNFRVPDDARLSWANEQVTKLGARLPQTQPEIYAREAIYLHERPQAELKLQVLRIGDLGIVAIPNEVYGITGLKLKAQSPFKRGFNIELANGAEGYIPPPEQHALGGYTTWPARTAGLEVQAEPRIVEALLGLLEEVAEKPRRPLMEEPGIYTQAVSDSKPAAYWRLNEMVIPTAHDATGHKHDATFEEGIALGLPGAGSGNGISPDPALKASNFSGTQINRAPHFAGGRMRANLPLGDNYSAEFWFWNGLPHDARPVTAYLFSRGTDADKKAAGEHLGIGGSYRGGLEGRLILFNGNERDELLAGNTVMALRAWHHVVLVREGKKVRVHLDGRAEPEITGELEKTLPRGEHSIFLGGRSDGLFGLEGRLDEVALYDRALSPKEIAAHYEASALIPPVAAAPARGAVESAPLSPLDSLKKIHVRNGYGVELVASEPLTMDPVAIDWDGTGRMWVVEMADYPLGMDGKGKSGGRVRLLEDTDGDGRYDKSTLFAEGLNFPTGLIAWRDGVIVSAAPDILFLRDTDGDGKADKREVLVSGLTQGNQQLRANGLRWGLDNWVYCAAGGHHGDYGIGTKLRTRAGEVLVGSRDFRFRPDTGEIEPQSGPSQFGRNRDDWGHWFGTQNSRPLWHYVLGDQYLRRNPHIAAPAPTHQVVVPLNPKVWPASRQEKRFHSFDQGGHFTSACSGMIYRDDLLFPKGEMHAFTCEPFHNLVQHNILADDGPSFSAHRAPEEDGTEFFASEDRWCRPVMTRTGPDGALWVVDMYRYMIEHPDWLPPEGKAELLPHYRLGEDKGRIYRVFPSGVATRKPLRLDSMDIGALVEALDSSNEWQRDKAHQLLLWRADKASIEPLTKLARESLNPLARLHALCVLDGLGALSSESVGRALADTHPGVRENAVRLAEKLASPEVITTAAKLADDPDAKVRLQLAFTLGEWNDPAAGAALGRLAVADYSDPFIFAAVMSSAVPHCRALAEAAVKDGGPALAALSEPLANLALALNERDALAALLAPALTPHDSSFTVAQLVEFTRFLDAVGARKTSLETLAVGTDLLAARIGKVKPLTDWARMAAGQANTPIELRAAAADMLTRLPSSQEEALALLKQWLLPDQPGNLQQAAVKSLSSTVTDSVPATLLAGWESYAPETRAIALDALLTRGPWTIALLEYSSQGHPLALDATRRAQLLKHQSARVRELAEKLLSPTATRVKVIEQFQPALKLTGERARGEAVFSRLCIGCHKLGELGRDIGPNLRSVAEHPPEKLLTNILDPNADVQPGFYAYQCRLVDGTELYGLIAAETGNSITIKLADGTTRAVLRKEIAVLKSANVSLMPEGLEAGMTVQEMADLIEFLRSGSGAAKAVSAGKNDLRVGASSVNLKADDTMPIAGSLEAHFTKEQEGQLRATALVVEKSGEARIAIVACDVLWVTRAIVDAALVEIQKTTGIAPSHVLVNATHTHHAPGTAPAHAFGWSEKFADEVRRGIVQAVQEANARLADAAFFYHLGEERTVGGNSRFLLGDGAISWLNPIGEAGAKVQPTGPFDPQLPVLDFRGNDGRTLALLFNHSTHTIGTRSGRDARSPGFYGLAAQELESELGGVIGFLEGASGSTHNVRNVPVPVAIERMKEAVQSARSQALPHPVTHIASLKRPFTFRVRSFDEAIEEAKVARYSMAYASQAATRIREIFADQRRELAPQQGQERKTWLQTLLIGDVAIVGVPAEYFTGLGLEIKRRSPFKNTFIAELANDWIGYLPDSTAHRLGGYQTWTGLHSYAEPGTGERIADEAVAMLNAMAGLK
ncbi:MAG: hypothetical protein JWL59_3633 [Chthoniobacteraceae bacterium]|nr:hypothetical protein [Chthoniobacteraceae bacterium]